MSARRRRTLAPRLYLWTQARVTTTLQAAKGAFDGLWLGALGEQQLDDLDASYYERQRVYAEDRHNTSGLQPWEQSFVETHLQEGDRVVVVGAGGGREVLALLEAGYDAVGFECNGALASGGADLLERRGWTGRLHAAQRDVWPSTVGPCDAAIVGWGAYMLIRGRDRRVAFLRGAREGLPAGAPVLLSFFARDGSTAYLRAVTAVGNMMRRVLRRPPIEAGDALAPNHVHYFTRDEIQRELADAGFDLATYETAGYGVAVGIAAPAAEQGAQSWTHVPTTSR